MQNWVIGVPCRAYAGVAPLVNHMGSVVRSAILVACMIETKSVDWRVLS
jgi:hypothetical protein